VHELGSVAFLHWLINRHRKRGAPVACRDRLGALVRSLEAGAAARESAEIVGIRVADGSGSHRHRSAQRLEPSAFAEEPHTAGTDPAAVYYLARSPFSNGSETMFKAERPAIDTDIDD
jgi:hypothetical protein